MAPTTPVSIKKARGLAAQKVKEGIDAEMEEFTSEFQTIEKDLQKHLLGNVKVFFKDMTFKWSDDLWQMKTEVQICVRPCETVSSEPIQCTQ